MLSPTKRGRFWHWACNRGFAFLAYVMIAIAAIALYREHPPITDVDFSISLIASVVSCTLIASGLASAHAVVYGLRRWTVALIKLEIPSLRILSVLIGFHGVYGMWTGDAATGAVEVGLALLLFHEMRTLSILRKGANGGLI